MPYETVLVLLQFFSQCAQIVNLTCLIWNTSYTPDTTHEYEFSFRNKSLCVHFTLYQCDFLIYIFRLNLKMKFSFHLTSKMQFFNIWSFLKLNSNKDIPTFLVLNSKMVLSDSILLISSSGNKQVSGLIRFLKTHLSNKTMSTYVFTSNCDHLGPILAMCSRMIMFEQES